MSRSTQPSIPPSEPAPFRHLGQGSADRSMRAQMVVAIVAGIVIVAVPLYLWRRPRGEGESSRASSSEGSNRPVASLSPLVTPIVAPSSLSASGRGVTLSETKIVKCSKPGKEKTPVEQCDHQPFFEDALAKAVQDNASCAPGVPNGGTVNYVLDVDHTKKVLRVWVGKSGSIKKAKTKEAVACVKRALPTPDWAQLAHQHTKYQISLMATYPPTAAP